jgi:ParB/RepB/Spo0J family partition protein
LELRYERLRLIRPARERQLLSSLAASGQQVPIVVVADAEPSRFVVVDGYKRVRCLQKLVRDVVLATQLDLGELEALVMSHQMSTADSETALEQGWLLDELENRFGLSQEDLARRFDRSVSWVSRRLGLVRELPESVQERVRNGEIVAHGAVKYLLPLARAKKSACEGLVAAVAQARLSSRDLGLLYTAWRDGTSKTRERLLAAPLVFLRAIKDAQAGRPSEPGPGQKLLNDLDVIGAVARRAHKQLREGAVRRLLPGESEEIVRCFEQSRLEVRRLGERLHKEVSDVGPGAAPGDPGVTAAGDERARDRAGDAGVPPGCTEDPAGGLRPSTANEPFVASGTAP